MFETYEKITIAGRHYRVGRMNKRQREQLPLFILSVLDLIPDNVVDGANNTVEFGTGRFIGKPFITSGMVKMEQNAKKHLLRLLGLVTGK